MSNLSSLNLGDASDAPEMRSFAPAPAGRYKMSVSRSEMKATKAGTGHYLDCMIEVVEEGPHKGKKVFQKFNLDNPNPVAVEIAKAEFGALCRACGITGAINDSSELHDIPFIGVLKIANGMNGNPQNEMADYMPEGGNPVAAVPAGQKPQWMKQE